MTWHIVLKDGRYTWAGPNEALRLCEAGGRMLCCGYFGSVYELVALLNKGGKV